MRRFVVMFALILLAGCETLYDEREPANWNPNNPGHDFYTDLGTCTNNAGNYTHSGQPTIRCMKAKGWKWKPTVAATVPGNWGGFNISLP